MRVLITGGEGALGSRVADALRKRGHQVAAPGRRGLDAASPMSWRGALAAPRALEDEDPRGPMSLPSFDVVIACVAWTDVAGCERMPGRSWRSNVVAAIETAEACLRAGVPLLFTSSDYAKGQGLQTVYGRHKAEAERQVRARHPLAVVARVCHLPPEKARNYSWLNGVTRSNRIWTEEAAGRVADAVGDAGLASMVHASPSGRPDDIDIGAQRKTTVAEMVRERWPTHPALIDVVTDPGELDRRCGFNVPRET